MVGSSSKADRPETQEEQMFLFECKGRKKTDVPAQDSQEGEKFFLLRLLFSVQVFKGLNGLDRAHSHKGGQPALLSLPI